MVHATLTPEIIRYKALDLLSDKMNEGIKQGNLIKLTEAHLLKDFVIPEHSIKNALWDLSDRYPDYVIKKKESYREVWLYPSEYLRESVPLSYYEEDRKRNSEAVAKVFRDAVEDMRNKRKEMMMSKILEMCSSVDLSGLIEMISEVQSNEVIKLTPSEQEIIFKVKFAIKDLKEARNMIVHQRGLGDMK